MEKEYKSILISEEFESLPKLSKRIFLVRHGHCNNILENITLNPKLSELGKSQARYLKKHFESIPIDIVYTSNLSRTIETSEIILEDRNIKYETNSLLNEIHTINEWESIPTEKIVNLVNHRNFNPLSSIEHGETYFDFEARVINFFENYIFKSKEKNILIVAHAEVINAILSFACKSNILGRIEFTFAFAHGSVTELRFVNSTPDEDIPENFCVIQKVNDISYFPNKQYITY